MPTLPMANIDAPTVFQAGPDALSLALMDARNQTLFLLAQFQSASPPVARRALWLAGHAAWFGEYWIGRNLQRAQGVRCPPQPARIASIEPRADHWWDGGDFPGDAPDADAVRAYLLETMESSLDLLRNVPHQDDALYFFRAALCHEDTLGEALLELAQTHGVAVALGEVQATNPRAPLGVPGGEFAQGSGGPGFHPGNEMPAHVVRVAGFEIDAQAVRWSQYAEFVRDGGYDVRQWWSDAGWDWLHSAAAADQGGPRRSPRHVMQIGSESGAVLQLRFGRNLRLGANQPAMHLSWWEADAYARWAGRRLPDESEWEMAVSHCARMGLRWGEVWEWTADRFRFYPGHAAPPCTPGLGAEVLQARVLRGGSMFTRQRAKSPQVRRAVAPDWDGGFVGFRTCAV